MPPIGPLTPQQVIILNQLGAAFRGADGAPTIQQAVRDAFVGGAGNGNDAVDTNAEVDNLAAIVARTIPADAPNREELLAAQRQIILNINQLIPNADNRARFFRTLATQMEPSNPLRTDPNITCQVDFYAANRGATIGVANRLTLAGQLHTDGNAIPQGRLQGLTGWQAHARQMFFGAWNNDGPGIKFTSTQEFIAMHAEARRQAMEQQGTGFNEAEFNQQFIQLYMTSIREDTNFNPQLLAQQASMALCRSRFQGQGSQEFLACLQGLNQTLWNEVASTSNRPAGSVLYVDQSGIPGHGNMVITVGANGQAQVNFTAPSAGVLFDFGAQSGRGGINILTAGIGISRTPAFNTHTFNYGPNNMQITNLRLHGATGNYSHVRINPPGSGGTPRWIAIPEGGLRIGSDGEPLPADSESPVSLVINRNGSVTFHGNESHALFGRFTLVNSNTSTDAGPNFEINDRTPH